MRPRMCWLILAVASPASADVDPASGIDFVRITHPGNAPWPGANPPIPGDQAVGRGRVDYEYSIGRYEVTTGQWSDFFNAAFDRPPDDRLPWLVPPTFWGAQATAPHTPGGLRWTVPAGNEMRPTGNISWRMAAMYCNWLHNDKSVEREAFLTGAYDVSTFGPNDTGGFSDQPTRSPDAKYFIPTRDEWIKAAHYDPDRHGSDQGGWWEYSNGTDEWIPGGPPGVRVHLGPPGPGPDPNGPLAQANYGWDQFTFPGHGSPFDVPLGAYADVQSPWGLLDLAGATTEWTEDIRTISDGIMFRTLEGSYWGGAPGFGIADTIWAGYGALTPNLAPFDSGLRIASIVPAPSSAMGILGGVIVLRKRKRK